MKKIIPAILTKDIAELQKKLDRVRGLADWVHIDVMDGVFVGNQSITMEDISRAGISGGIFLEAHLMVVKPETYFRECEKNNIARVIFHIETGDTKNILFEADKFNFQKGLALNPQTPVEEIMPYVNEIDVVLLMSVNPGFGGQAFMPETLSRITKLKKMAPSLKIEVDGGVNLDTIGAIFGAGADCAIVGSGLFEAENIKSRFETLQKKIT